jgi:CheY-like chemotaxis protein
MSQQTVPSGRSGFRVFVADDDQDQRSLLVDVLRAEGYFVVEASDGATLMLNLVRFALETRGRTDGALVICDVRMPGCNGLAVMRNILEHGSPCPRFAFMTAFPDPGVYEEARELGATRVLAKPFDIDELRGLVREAAASSSASGSA